MKIIPLLEVKSMESAIAFYTGILDFRLKYPGEPLNPLCVELINGDAELQLTQTGVNAGIAVNVYVDEVDRLCAKYISRGLITPGDKNSPVHEGPLNQSWGRLKFYVTDADGNTLRFTTLIRPL